MLVQIHMHFFLFRENPPDLHFCDWMQNLVLSYTHFWSLKKLGGEEFLSLVQGYIASQSITLNILQPVYCPVKQAAELLQVIHQILLLIWLRQSFVLLITLHVKGFFFFPKIVYSRIKYNHSQKGRILRSLIHIT